MLESTPRWNLDKYDLEKYVYKLDANALRGNGET